MSASEKRQRFRWSHWPAAAFQTVAVQHRPDLWRCTQEFRDLHLTVNPFRRGTHRSMTHIVDKTIQLLFIMWANAMPSIESARLVCVNDLDKEEFPLLRSKQAASPAYRLSKGVLDRTVEVGF